MHRTKEALSSSAEPVRLNASSNPHRPRAKSSALLIAGVRENPLSRKVAGEEGVALAQRFAAVTPEFPECIRARDIHSRRTIVQHYDRISQVVVLGVGLDVKPLELASKRQAWYGIDLAEGLALRAELLSGASLEERYFTVVEADLRGDEWDARLRSAGFDGAQPTLFIVEGLSMYMPLPSLNGLFTKLRNLTVQEDCLVWMDHFSHEFFVMAEPTVKSFIDSMARMGEPFVTGFSTVEWLNETGWSNASTTRAKDLVTDTAPVLGEYLFSVLCRRRS